MGLYIFKEYYLENNALFCIHSTTAKKRKPEPEQAGGDGEGDGDGVAEEVKPSIHEFDAKVEPPPKLTKKSKEHDFMKEVITNLLNNEDDEINFSLQGVA